MGHGAQSFYNQNKPGLDKCAKNAKNHVNESIKDYNLWNSYSCEKQKEEALSEFAMKNLNLRYKKGYGVAPSCHVDTDTELRLNAKWTSERAKTQLFSRFYTGNPDMSRGKGSPEVESKLVQGDDTYRLKMCQRLSEKEFDRFTPMLPCLKDSIQKVEHIVMPFHQGGENSREFMRSLQPKYTSDGCELA
jgi:hypothetical protein